MASTSKEASPDEKKKEEALLCKSSANYTKKEKPKCFNQRSPLQTPKRAVMGLSYFTVFSSELQVTFAFQ